MRRPGYYTRTQSGRSFGGRPINGEIPAAKIHPLSDVRTRPIHVLPMTIGGRKIDGLIPPIYVSYQKIFEIVLADLKENALGRDVRIGILKTPLKSPAVHILEYTVLSFSTRKVQRRAVSRR